MTAAELAKRGGGVIVSAPGWAGGSPVRVVSAGMLPNGKVAVRYQDVNCRTRAVIAHVDPDFQVTLRGGGR